jgi:hypothetical protein
VLLPLLVLPAALLMAPGLRYGKVLQVLLKPPMWARNFAGGPSLTRLLVQAGFLVQVLMLPLWVSGFGCHGCPAAASSVGLKTIEPQVSYTEPVYASKKCYLLSVLLSRVQGLWVTVSAAVVQPL